MMRWSAAAAALLLAWGTAAAAPLSAATEVGRALFFDEALSASGRQSCASCHDPAHAYAPANDRAVQLGGPDLRTPGTRAVPTLMYKEHTPRYSDRLANPDRISPPGPGGGYGWDGRADTLAEQALLPLLAPGEMANVTRAALAARLRRSDSAPKLRALIGTHDFGDDDRLVATAAASLEAFQREDASFHPYRSRFDRYRGNKMGGELSEQELRGFDLFVRPDKGNCNACHLLGPAPGGAQDATTDYSFAALGVPRNPEIPANADASRFDLGLCGPERKDHVADRSACGLFKTPVLRNVAARRVFMHNGKFKSLREVLRFYATRDSNPERWYPVVNGHVEKYDDLPASARGNIDRQPPLDGRPAGSSPALSESDIDDLIAFLETLDDD